MALDSDIVLFGTGVAPLVAANYLLLQGKSVLILNPDLDFFLENSELPLDPLLHGKIDPVRLLKNSIEQALDVIRPIFPGPIEIWPDQTGKSGYHDPSAPHVRQRGRLWISSKLMDPLWNWEQLEDLYVEASDAGLNPQILEGLPAIRRFPGVSSNTDHFRGLFIPKLCDIDVARYRNGMLEYIREKIEPEKVICDINQLEIVPGGIRFHAKGVLNSAKVKEALLVFWTPRLSQWVMNQAKKFNRTPPAPRGVRIWEQWSLNSREQPAPTTIGMYGGMAVWADFEGLPSLPPPLKHEHDQPESSRLAVLRSGPLISLDEMDSPQAGKGWVSEESLSSLTQLCHDFLKWDRFSIRSLQARAIFEWGKESSWQFEKIDPVVKIIGGCDGPLIQVLENVQSACETLIGGNS